MGFRYESSPSRSLPQQRCLYRRRLRMLISRAFPRIVAVQQDDRQPQSHADFVSPGTSGFSRAGETMYLSRYPGICNMSTTISSVFCEVLELCKTLKTRVGHTCDTREARLLGPR